MPLYPKSLMLERHCGFCYLMLLGMGKKKESFICVTLESECGGIDLVLLINCGSLYFGLFKKDLIS